MFWSCSQEIFGMPWSWTRMRISITPTLLMGCYQTSTKLATLFLQSLIGSYGRCIMLQSFRDIVWSFWNICCKIHTLHSDIVTHCQSQKTHTMGASYNSWEPPNFPFVKLNTGGRSFGNSGATSFGGILWNHLGNFIFCFVGSYGVSTILQAETAQSKFFYLNKYLFLLS